MSELSVRDSLRGLRALIDQLESKAYSGIVVNECSEENCHLPLNPSQSRLLADLVTAFVPRSTWWSTQERKELWALCGALGEDSGPQLTVFITATSDREVLDG